MSMIFENLKESVLSWAHDKGILVSENRFKQALKMVSEVGELCDSVIKGDIAEQKDSIGDVLVTVIILAEQLGHDPVACLDLAYNVIRDRTGKTVDGVFIKDVDFTSLKVGDMLTAKDVCLMDTGSEALIIGKRYPIIRIEGNSLFIISEGDLIEHEFYFDDLDEFFTI